MKCKELDWVEANSEHYDWYYSEYPELFENDVTLPVPFEKLKLFYVLDMDERNLTPLNEFLNCYEHLFSYFLGRLDGTIYVQGRSWIELTIENFPKALKKTYEDISNPFGVPMFVWVILIIIIGTIVLVKT